MKNLSKCLLFFLFSLLWAGKAQSQELIYTGKNGINHYFQLYAGDRLKIEFAGSNKKMTLYFQGTSDPIKSTDDYWKRMQKVDDIEKSEMVVTRDGAHQVITFKVKGEGDMKLYRYPAPGKEKLPTLFTPKYSLVYREVKTKGPVKRYQKFLNPDMELLGGLPATGNYLPADVELKKPLTGFNQAKGIVVYNDKVIIGPVPYTDSTVHNQRAYAFQKGDTVAFEVAYTPSAKIASVTSTVWVGRPDEYFSFLPEVYGGMKQYLMQVTARTKDKPASGSFVVMNDGIFSFYFQERGTYDLKVVRHPGPGGNPDYNMPIEWIPVYRKELGSYAEEPRVK